MDERIRKLERLAATGDSEAKRQLLREHLRCGILKPADPGVVKRKLAMQSAEIRKKEDRERRGPRKRLSAAQRKAKRQDPRWNRYWF